MAWIRQIPDDEADGLLARIYADAVARAGRVWNIVRVQGLNPRQLRASLGLYASVMRTDTSLPPRLCETLAVVVSRANGCHY
ncbi:MAG: hypothetical protein D6702_07870 [Planctomycetota bacterium]|nr:MAG: hypothetical protein D6702_07870 [Planctomycetota bacterium]